MTTMIACMAGKALIREAATPRRRVGQSPVDALRKANEKSAKKSASKQPDKSGGLDAGDITPKFGRR